VSVVRQLGGAGARAADQRATLQASWCEGPSSAAGWSDAAQPSDGCVENKMTVRIELSQPQRETAAGELHEECAKVCSHGAPRSSRTSRALRCVKQFT
jgi:hypothetical protein